MWGLSVVDDTAKVSKSTKPSIGASKGHFYLRVSGRYQALLSRRSEIMRIVADQFAETPAAAGVKRIYGRHRRRQPERADQCDFPSGVGGFRERLVEIGQRTYAHLENSR
jgi:hypothetical protein